MPLRRFEELGFDRLYVDEAHYHKNPFTYTKMSNIPGISTTDAKKTTDMYEKCRYLNEANKGKCGIAFDTAIPVSNSMTKLFTMQRYLQPDRLEDESLKFFDSLADNFGKTVTAVELSPEEKGLCTKTRFAKFHNLPELMSMFKEVADLQDLNGKTYTDKTKVTNLIKGSVRKILKIYIWKGNFGEICESYLTYSLCRGVRH